MVRCYAPPLVLSVGSADLTMGSSLQGRWPLGRWSLTSRRLRAFPGRRQATSMKIQKWQGGGGVDTSATRTTGHQVGTDKAGLAVVVAAAAIIIGVLGSAAVDGLWVLILVGFLGMVYG